MKNRNPYLSVLVLWIIAICFSLSACVIGIVSGILWQSFVNLALVILDSIFLGWCICKFNAYRELLKTKKALEDGLKQFEELMKIKENEPFKEFENNGESSSRKV